MPRFIDSARLQDQFLRQLKDVWQLTNKFLKKTYAKVGEEFHDLEDFESWLKTTSTEEAVENARTEEENLILD
jgi:hypothetical protein